MTENLRVHVYVTGRVQGVWFRESTRQKAVELGVCGWVCNLADGRVEALFEGCPESVRAAVGFVRVGPPHANVEHVEIAEETLTSVESPPTSGFTIR